MGETEWARAAEPDAPDGERTVPVFIVGAFAGMVTLCLIWGITAFLTRTGTSSELGPVATAPGASSPSSVVVPSQSPQESPERDGCQQANAELAAPLLSVVPAMDQWEVHVGAMNKLVVGAITAEQASAFWAESKVGAVRNLNRFQAATRRLVSAGVDCPSPADVAKTTPKLRSCAQRVAQERRVLEAARIAMGTWGTHIHDMTMLSMGHLSPEEGTQRWLANWQRGIREIRAYRGAERAVDASDRC